MSGRTNIRNGVRLGVLAVLAACAAAATGCRDERTNRPPRQFFPDMDDQEKYKTQAESPFFADGRTMREPVAGTVAFGRSSELGWGATDGERALSDARTSRERADLLRADEAVYFGRGADGKWVEYVPLPVDEALMRRGQERYNIYCIVCHGPLGDGKGMVGQQWSYDLPTFHQSQYYHGGEKGQDGYIFNVIRNGLPNVPGAKPDLKMPAYGAQIDERDAWAIVAYVRALQRARATPFDEVPEGGRRELERTRQAPAGGTEGGQ